jgi:prolyl 4-hydroxylase
MKKIRVKSNKAEIYTIDNFLTSEECKYIIEYIDTHNTRSHVSGGKYKNKSGVSKARTSSTSNLRKRKFPYIEKIDKKMSRSINVPLELGEATQGQKYEVGQEFKDHTDYFSGASLRGHGDRWGNRGWTFMIYLNGDCEGGETEFKKLGLSFKPKTGTAVIWRNLKKDGKPNPFTIHAGRPVKSGTKYIITKWFREFPTGEYPLSGYFKKTYPHLIREKLVPAVRRSEKKIMAKTFSGHDDFPKFTEKGFELRDVPTETWELIKDTYSLLKKYKKPEKFKGQMSVIHDKEKKTSPIDILSLGNVKSVKKIIHEQLHPHLEKWSGEAINPSMMYGIRSYKKGAILEAHMDRPKTHHISAIIIVDENSNKPWPLDIQDHSGKWHKVYAKPGQMILYESAACMHGRLEEFDGEYFRNFFVHYQLNDWSYEPKVNKKAKVKA